jgi:predicted acetyltransferase
MDGAPSGPAGGGAVGARGVDVVPAEGRAARAVLAELFDRYIVDLSTHTDFYALDAEGRWQPDGLALWWAGEGRHRYLVHVDGRAAGFVLVGAPPFPWVTPGRDFCLAELFVSRAVRGHGAGRAAVAAVLARHAGRWEVPTDPANAPAVAFWQRVVEDLGLPGHDVVATPHELVHRFEVPAGWAPPAR